MKGHIYEEFGFKAHNKGFFTQWQQLSKSISKSYNLPLHDASERAYEQLKFKER